MANSRSARKQIRANERKRIRNQGVRSSVRTKVGKAKKSLLDDHAEVNVEEELLIAVKALDRAAEKGILHRNNARRRKARLTRMAAQIMRAVQSGGDVVVARAAASGGQKGKTTRAKKVPVKTPAKAKGSAKTAEPIAAPLEAEGPAES